MNRVEIAKRLKDLAAVGEEVKCLTCRCFVEILRQVVEEMDSADLLDTPEGVALDDLLGRAHRAASHGCLGCDPCLPVEPFNDLNLLLQAGGGRAAGGECGTPAKEAAPSGQDGPGRGSWPPFPGEYRVVDPEGSVAVCALGDRDLYEALSGSPPEAAAIVGMLATENLGIERLVRNVLANPSIRSLVLCGEDSRGHRAGACLAALGERGVDGEMRIRGAPGIRPRLVNLLPEEVHAFLGQVRIVPRIGEKNLSVVAGLVNAAPNKKEHAVPSAPRAAFLRAERVASRPDAPADPAGYFVIDADNRSGLIRMEHYDNENRLVGAFEGKRSRDLYLAAAERGMISRLDHAAYLGYELGRAEDALRRGTRFVQDAR